jgi:hypothetical protein
MTSEISIFHIPNKTENYTIIYNELLKRDDISGLAKGMWCYMMMLPPTWKLHRSELYTHFTEGRKLKTKAFNELIEKGYIIAEQPQKEGKFESWEYKVYESSQYPLVQRAIVQSAKVQCTKEHLLSTNEVVTDESTTDATKISLSKDKDKLLPEPSRDDLCPDYIKLCTEVGKSGLFKKVPLYKKNSTIPISDALDTQEIMFSLLKGTFIKDCNVTIKSNQVASWLNDMSLDRIISICTNPKLKDYYHPDNFKDFFVAHRSGHQSRFLTWARPQYGTVPSNCNTTIPTVTMQKDVTIPKKIMDQFARIKAFPRISKSLNDKKLQDHLIFLDKWWQNSYPTIKDYNQKYVGSYCGSFETIIDCLLNIMEGWQGKIFDESFFEYGKWGWNQYIKNCTEAGVDIIITDKMLERRKLDKEIAESNRKLRERNALREEAGLPPSVIPTSDGKLPYEIENERLAAIKAAKKQVELDERKKVEEAMREKVRNGGSIL